MQCPGVGPPVARPGPLLGSALVWDPELPAQARFWDQIRPLCALEPGPSSMAVHA